VPAAKKRLATPAIGAIVRYENCPNALVMAIFQVLAAASTNITAFWDVASCTLVENGPTCQRWLLSHHVDVSEMLTVSIGRTVALMMEAVSASETVVSFYLTARCSIPEGSHLHGSGPIASNATHTQSLEYSKWLKCRLDRFLTFPCVII
jgi:hypothetical protein